MKIKAVLITVLTVVLALCSCKNGGINVSKQGLWLPGLPQNADGTPVHLSIKGCSEFIDPLVYEKYLEKSMVAFDLLNKGLGPGQSKYGWMPLPLDLSDSLTRKCENIRDGWKKKGINLAVVIGIGASVTNSQSIIKTLQGRNLVEPGNIEVIFAGNSLSEDDIYQTLEYINEKNAACICISRSGSTLESAVAFRIIRREIEKKYGKEESKSRIVVVTSKGESRLNRVAKAKGYPIIYNDSKLSGRYQLMTASGLLPICIAGYDINKLQLGAACERAILMRKNRDNNALQYAAIRNILYEEVGKKIEILSCYDPQIKHLGEWWRQLYGESMGKNRKGIFPVTAFYTNDLHSLGQYILEGDKIIFETSVSCYKSNNRVSIEKEDDDEDVEDLNKYAGLGMKEISRFAEAGTRYIHIRDGVPQINIVIEKIDEFNLGALCYFFQYSCAISGFMMGMNPFDQPGVDKFRKSLYNIIENTRYEGSEWNALKNISPYE